MIAKFEIILPFSILVPENETFNTITFDYEGYKIIFHPLSRSQDADKHTNFDSATINGENGINTDTLQVSFSKNEFDRRIIFEFDPPLKFVERVVNDFLLRLRYLTNAHNVKIVNIDSLKFSVKYLNDDGSELIPEEGKARGKVKGRIKFDLVGVNNEVWSKLTTLTPFQPLPAWKYLLLDAKSVLPEIGPSIILVFTALEVFISTTLDEIVTYKQFDPNVWNWINNRGFFLKEPSIDERFDFLSFNFIGISLKENKVLWEAFKNLQTARNSFAHDGIAKIGGNVVNESKATEFIDRAMEITEYFKSKLPIELHWPEFKSNLKLAGSTQINF